MNVAIIFVSILVLVLMALLVWALRSPKETRIFDSDLKRAEGLGRQHLTHFPQICKAISPEDLEFVGSRGSGKLARRVRRERRAISLSYLACLRGEFMRLWRLARVVAAMSPRVAVMSEFERFRLGVAFNLHYGLLRIKFVLGLSAAPDFRVLSQTVSKLAVRLETAMSELGERAAVAS